MTIYLRSFEGMKQYVGMTNDEVFKSYAKTKITLKYTLERQISTIFIAIITLGLILIVKRFREECLGRKIIQIDPKSVKIFKDAITELNIDFSAPNCIEKLNEIGKIQLLQKYKELTERKEPATPPAEDGDQLQQEGDNNLPKGSKTQLSQPEEVDHTDPTSSSDDQVPRLNDDDLSKNKKDLITPSPNYPEVPEESEAEDLENEALVNAIADAFVGIGIELEEIDDVKDDVDFRLEFGNEVLGFLKDSPMVPKEFEGKQLEEWSEEARNTFIESVFKEIG